MTKVGGEGRIEVGTLGTLIKRWSKKRRDYPEDREGVVAPEAEKEP
jgi:hypothetical protein